MRQAREAHTSTSLEYIHIALRIPRFPIADLKSILSFFDFWIWSKTFSVRDNHSIWKVAGLDLAFLRLLRKEAYQFLIIWVCRQVCLTSSACLQFSPILLEVIVPSKSLLEGLPSSQLVHGPVSRFLNSWSFISASTDFDIENLGKHLAVAVESRREMHPPLRLACHLE